jgi:hypothetical protein
MFLYSADIIRFMTFSKSFPRQVKGISHPIWEEIYLTPEEDREQEELCRKDNIRIMNECIDDSKEIIEKNDLKRFQSDMVNIANQLFHKRASYSVHWKENKSKEKYDKKFNP